LLANFNGNHPYGPASKGPDLERTCKAGSYKPNAFGLYDMHGTVWEWCADWYGADSYSTSPRRDPQGPSSGSLRVLRGGGWSYFGQGCRSGNRDRLGPDARSDFLGFRAALVPSE
jgi:formylglycine-generating enzyme required for sulfatase activity